MAFATEFLRDGNLTAMLDSEKPLTFLRALRSPEYWLLLIGCIAAVRYLSAQYLDGAVRQQTERG
jgi:hypothetical protein